MTIYDKEYFFLRKPNDDRLPSLVADENTEGRRYSFERQSSNSAPLVFYNAWKDSDKKNGIVSIVPNILFAGENLVVRSSIRERLLEKNIPSMYMHPSIYIDDRDHWHEDFWYLTFTDWLDCWDRNTSDYETDIPPISLGGFELHQVYTYSLNASLFDQTPLQERLLFKMGGSVDAFVVCHSSLTSVFSAGELGIRFQAISDY